MGSPLITTHATSEGKSCRSIPLSTAFPNDSFSAVIRLVNSIKVKAFVSTCFFLTVAVTGLNANLSNAGRTAANPSLTSSFRTTGASRLGLDLAFATTMARSAMTAWTAALGTRVSEAFRSQSSANRLSVGG